MQAVAVLPAAWHFSSLAAHPLSHLCTSAVHSSDGPHGLPSSFFTSPSSKQPACNEEINNNNIAVQTLRLLVNIGYIDLPFI
jgi:hypothetical protein